MTVELSYAGRTLRILPPRESMRIERYMSTSDLHEWDQRDITNNAIQHLPIPEVYYPAFRLGSLWWPTGASKFAIGRYVITQSDLDVIGPLALPTAGPQPQNLVLSYNGRNTTTEMFLLPPRPMFMTQAGTEPMYFITLVDKRFYWWFKTGSILSSDLTTWSSLLSSILFKIGESSAIIDTISDDYGVPSTRWVEVNQYLPILLDAACFACGLRCVRQMDGTVILQNACNAKNINAIEIRKAFPSDPYSGSGSGSGSPTYIPLLGGIFDQQYIASSVPSAVRVVQTEDYSAQIPLSTFAEADPSNSGLRLNAYSGVQGFDGSKIIFADPNGSGTGIVSGSGSGSGCCNTIEIGYNRRVAKDWYCWQLSTPDVLFRDLVNWDINGLNEYVEIRWTPEHVTTEVRRPTINSRTLGSLFNSGDPLDRLFVGCSGSGGLSGKVFFTDRDDNCKQVPCGSGCSSGDPIIGSGDPFAACCNDDGCPITTIAKTWYLSQSSLFTGTCPTCWLNIPFTWNPLSGYFEGTVTDCGDTVSRTIYMDFYCRDVNGQQHIIMRLNDPDNIAGSGSNSLQVELPAVCSAIVGNDCMLSFTLVNDGSSPSFLDGSAGPFWDIVCNGGINNPSGYLMGTIFITTSPV